MTNNVIEYRGQSIGRVHKGFGAVVEGAGLEGRGITPHIMRHSAMTWLMQAGEDIYKVAGFAGHKDIKMIVQRYGHHHPDFQSGIAKTLSQKR
ncbi:tyrosine-type recombinase/integrase [Cypionkella sinensis]|uniref:Tyrosine-type recombinase/integrase n=1 Tax=Cypionkella sinensis TaxID=1756043 RepID=A0ABV7IS63_9RHOB